MLMLEVGIWGGDRSVKSCITRRTLEKPLPTLHLARPDLENNNRGAVTGSRKLIAVFSDAC